MQNEIQNILGQLESSDRHFEERLNRIESKVDSLLEFKYRALGIAALAAFIATLSVEIVKAK